MLQPLGYISMRSQTPKIRKKDRKRGSERQKGQAPTEKLLLWSIRQADKNPLITIDMMQCPQAKAVKPRNCPAVV